MCGIAGLIRWSGLSPAETDAGWAMASTLTHRGPDEISSYSDRFASLGHTRLSIIDIEGGHQPAANEDGSIRVVFNGEIYNHRELRSGLIARGHQLASDCDTEVIAHLYEDHGADFVEHLNGMFAIAIWDSPRHQLLLIRDRMGVKPLYWQDDGRAIAFGSELKALRVSGSFNPQVDPLAIWDYFTFGHVPAPRTIYQGVHKLEPGHLVICRETGVQVRQYWDIPHAEPSGPTSFRNDDEQIDALASLLQDATRIRMVADVPLGAFLSGGLDSASIVAAMSRTGTAQKLSTHTIGFVEQAFDERDAARQTASSLGTTHHETLVEVNAVDAASRLAWHFDEPFADSSCVPTYYLSQAARREVTVALAGDGADELLGGYRRYRFDLAEEAWRHRLPGFARRIARAAGQLYPKADWLPRPLRARVTLQNLALDPIRAHLRSTSLRCGLLPSMLLRPDVMRDAGQYDPYEHPVRLAQAFPSADLLGRLLYLDSKTLLPDDMLTKVDRASMAVGLEVREPLLDYRLVEHVARMPSPLRLGKAGLRGVMRQWGLPALADRSKKGFDVPTDAWFRGPLRELARDLLTSKRSGSAEWLQPRTIQRLIQRHDRGWANEGAVLWTLLSFELWTRAVRDISRRAGQGLPLRNHPRACQEVTL